MLCKIKGEDFPRPKKFVNVFVKWLYSAKLVRSALSFVGIRIDSRRILSLLPNKLD
jgi:hypothetical protein